MSRSSTFTRLLATGLLLLGGGTALAQDGNQPDAATEDNNVMLREKAEGWPIKELFKAIAELRGISILFESNNATIKSKNIEFIGDQVIPEDRVFDWLQAVLSYHNLVLVPVGPTGDGGQQQWMAIDQANANLTSRPVYIDEDEIEDYADRDGLYVVTTLTMEYVSDPSRVRQALQQLSTKTAGLGRMNDVPDQSAIIVGDFAPIVAAMKQLLTKLDVENNQVNPRMEMVQLVHAVATEIEPIIQELIEQSSTTRGGNNPGRQPRQPTDTPEPKIIADPRLDALIIYAVDSDMKEIKSLISQLDIENTNYRQRIHFRPLKHTSANGMAELIQELIDETGVGASGARRNNRRNAGGANNNAAAGAFGGGTTEGSPVILADTRSNSLIVHASPTQFDEIDVLIQKLDVARPQVLIETALIEVSLSDQMNLGVELFATGDDVLVDTDGDGVGDTLTNSTDFFTTTAFGIGSIVNETVDGISVPVNRSPTIGTGLTAGIFKDGRMPALVTAFASSGRAKILTMPSVVTNDNEQAELTLTRTTSFTQTVRDDTGQNTDSFQPVTATTQLTISPTISSDNYLRLTIDQTVANFGARPSQNAPPDQTDRTISTQVTLPDRYTVVLGGLVQQENRTTATKVPYLGDIPVLGWLFRSTEDTSNPSHLFLFVTPRILRDTGTFEDYYRLTWERKLLQDDLFGSEVEFITGQFRKPGAGESAAERLRRLQESGLLDGARLKTPASEAEREAEARESARDQGLDKLPTDDASGGDGE